MRWDTMKPPNMLIEARTTAIRPKTFDTPNSAGTDPHDLIRYIPQAQDMADQFLRTGKVMQTCASGGPCVSMDSQVNAASPTGVDAAEADAGVTDAQVTDAQVTDAGKD